MQALARALALLGALALAGCGSVDFGGLFGGKGKEAPQAASKDQVPANTVMGTVEVDGNASNANLRVEIYEITGRDPAEAMRGEPLVVARTQRDGTYQFNLGPLARAPQGQTRTWLVRTGGETTAKGRGPEATVTFTTAAARGRLPPLYVWDGSTRIEETEDRLIFKMAPLPNPKRMEPAVYGIELTAQGGGTPLPSAQGGTPQTEVPRLLLQELPWTYRPVAALELTQADGTVYHATYRGSAKPIQGAAPPPLTRQRDAKLVPPGLGFKGLTDGKLENMLPHTMPPGGKVEIDLGSATEVGQVYLVGLEVVGSDQVSVHLSNSPAQPGPPLVQVRVQDAFEIKLPPGSRGRHLTVSFAGQVVALAEIIAYPPLAATRWEAAKPVAPFSNAVSAQTITAP